MAFSFRQLASENQGARPYPCDFHLHAPPDWTDSLGDRAVDQYIEDVYLPRLYSSGRRVVGITQHNSIVDGGAKKVRDIARRLLEGGRRDIPVVFPGYELTSSDQLQVVLLANPDHEDTRRLDLRLEESLRLRRDRWHESSLTLRDILLRLREGFQSDLVVLAVATGHKGILETRDLATKHRLLYRDVVFLSDGFILGGPYDALDDFTRCVLMGEIGDYSDTRAAFLQTSDARTLDGLSATSLSYVKLGSFSTEALRQALLNCRTFVSTTPFQEPNLDLLRLRVRNTVFFDSLEIGFNPNMTCLVGGRGTGKSCLLEYISHVCQYERSLEMDRPNKSILILRKEHATEGTLLAGTEIELHIKVGTKFYRIQRKGTAGPEISECADDRCEGGVPLSPRSPSALLNLRFFGQRELANIVREDDFFTLDPERRGRSNLFSFLKSDQLSAIEVHERRARQLTDEIEKLSVDMASWAEELAKRPRLIADRDRLNEELENIRRQAAHPDLQNHPEYLQVQTVRDDLFAQLTVIHSEQLKLIKAIQDKQKTIEKPWPLTKTGAEPSLGTLRTAALTQLDSLVASLEGLAESWKGNTDALQQSAENDLISEQLREHAIAYAAAKKEMEANKINLSLLEPLQARLLEINVRLESFADQDAKLSEARSRRQELVTELRSCRATEGDIYQELASFLTASTNARVRMSISRAGNIRRAVVDFQSFIKDGRRFNAKDADQLEETFKSEASQRREGATSATLWTEVVDFLVAAFERLQDQRLGRLPIADDPARCAWLAPLRDKLSDLVATFDDKSVGGLLCLYVPDLVNMELRRKVEADDYIPIRQASVGQKATALFLILLAQTDGVLVIDQPEDDLDNAFIANDILPAIQDLKHLQQIVFATHNANMVVNAESEKIVILDTEPRPDSGPELPPVRGRVLQEGGIDNEIIRRGITTILEGGREAFLARERKYRFAQTS